MEAYLGISTDKLLTAGAETIYMVCISLFIGAIIAFPLAILLYLTRKNGMYQNRFVNGLLNIIINVIRSTPFIIMLVCVMPLTKVLVGTRIGTKAALVPLTIYIAPYLARLMEGALPVSLRLRRQWARHRFRSYGISFYRNPLAL